MSEFNSCSRTGKGAFGRDFGSEAEKTCRLGKEEREKVPMYSAEDFFSGKKDAKPVGLMSNPDAFGPVVVDRETFFRLTAKA